MSSSISRARRRLRHAGMAAGISSMVAGAVWVTAPPAAGVGTVADAPAAATSPLAFAVAKAHNHAVEVSGLGSDTTTTFANPDGSMTATVTPVRSRWKDSAGSWHDIDLSMTQEPDGSLAPKSESPERRLRLPGRADGAVSFNTPVGSYSITHPLITAASVTAAATVSAAAAPIARAVPANATVSAGGGRSFDRVMSGRGLTEQATVDGVEESVTLADAEQSGTYTDVVTVPRGVTATQTSLGVEFDGPGGVVDAGLTGGIAHDSLPTPSGDGAETQATSTLVSQHGRDVTVQVSVSSQWLTDSARVFPVVIDPQFYQDTSANGSGAINTYVQTDGNGPASTGLDPTLLRVGYGFGSDGKQVARSLLWFKLDDISSDGVDHGPIPQTGMHVTSATFAFVGAYSSSCTATPIVVMGLSNKDYQGNPAPLFTRKGATWGNQPKEDGLSQEWSSPFAANAVGHGCDQSWEYSSISELAQRWFGGSDPSNPKTNSMGTAPQANLGMRVSTDELPDMGWKKLGAGESGQSWAPRITVNYLPDQAPSTPVQACPDCGISSTPLLTATSTDPDGDNIGYDFKIYADDGSGALVYDHRTSIVTGDSTRSPSGVPVYWRPPANLLKPGAHYTWTAAGEDRVLWGPTTGFMPFINGSGAAITIPPPATLGDDPDTGVSDDPVNMATGDFLESEDTVGFQGTWTPQVQLTYNSLDKSVGSVGAGWSSVLDEHATADSAGNVSIRFPDGRVLLFTRQASGYASPSGFNGALSDATGAGWALAYPDGEVDTFGSAGALATSADGSGDILTFGQSGGHVTSISSSTGYALSITYNAANLVNQVTTGDGRSATFTYAGSTLTKLSRAQGSRTFAYDSSANLVTVTDEDGLTVVNNTYDAVDRVIEQTRPGQDPEFFTYTPSAGVSAITDAAGNPVVSYGHDATGHLTYVGDKNGVLSSRSYDANERPTSVTKPGGAAQTATYTATGLIAQDAIDGKTQDKFTYDDQGRTLTHTDAAGTTTTLTYSGNDRTPTTESSPGTGTTRNVVTNGLLTSSTDADGHTVKYTYDSHGDETSVLAPDGSSKSTTTYDGAGRVTSVTLATGGVTNYKYDAAGRLAETDGPLGSQTKSTYTPAGRLATSTDADGLVTSYTYDTAGRVQKTTYPDGSSTTNTYDGNSHLVHTDNSNGPSTDMTYDAAGRLLSSTSGGQTVSYTYDADGNQLSQAGDDTATGNTVDDTGAVTSESDAAGNVAKVVNDADGRPLAATLPDGTVTHTSYDASGHVLTSTDGLGRVVVTNTYTAGGQLATSTDALGRKTSYTYDAFGYVSTVTSPGGNVTSYTHDAAGRVLKTVTPLGITSLASYDVAGNLTSATDPNGGVTTETYDSSSRPTSVTLPGGATKSYTYDLITGQQKTVTDPMGGIAAFTYDANGRMATETNPRGKVTKYAYNSAGQTATKTDPLGRITSYAYDSKGHLTKVVAPDGTVGTTTYNALGQITSTSNGGVTTSFTYDVMGRRATMTDATGTTSYSYDAAGERTKIAGPSGTFAFAYDAAGEPTTLTFPDGNIETYAYDLNGNISKVSDNMGHAVTYVRDADGRVTSSSSTEGTARTFTYNKDQLTKYSQQMGTGAATDTSTMTYNTAEQMASLTSGGVTTSYSYDKGARLTSVSPSSGGSTSYTYDADGNRLSRVTSTQSDSYNYDAGDELTTISRNGGSYGTFTYDGRGRLTNIALTTGRSSKFGYGAGGRITSMDRVAPEGHQVATITYNGDGYPVTVQTSVTPAGSQTATSGSARLSWLGAPGGAATVAMLSKTANGTTANSDELYGVSREISLDSSTSSAGTSAHDAAQDAFGSAIPTPATAGVTAEQSFDTWGLGLVWPTIPSVPVGFSYRGGISVADMTLFNDRAYDGLFARFSAPDPADPLPGSASGYTPYSYAADDPLDKVDPSGDSAINPGTPQDTIDGNGPDGGKPVKATCTPSFPADKQRPLDRQTICLGPLNFATRARGQLGVGNACLLWGIPCTSAAGNFRPEATAVSHAIRKLSLKLGSDWGAPLKISNKVMWEVGVDGTGSDTTRADIMADAKGGGELYEAKNFTAANVDTVGDQLDEYIARLARHKVYTAPGQTLKGWVITYSSGTGANPLVSGLTLGKRCWAWDDFKNHGIIWFSCNRRLVDRSLRYKAHDTDVDIADKVWNKFNKKSDAYLNAQADFMDDKDPDQAPPIMDWLEIKDLPGWARPFEPLLAANEDLVLAA